MYTVINHGDGKLDAELTTYNKTFSKKPIQQLQVIPDYKLLVSLTGNVYFIIGFTSFGILMYMQFLYR